MKWVQGSMSKKTDSCIYETTESVLSDELGDIVFSAIAAGVGNLSEALIDDRSGMRCDNLPRFD